MKFHTAVVSSLLVGSASAFAPSKWGLASSHGLKAVSVVEETKTDAAMALEQTIGLSLPVDEPEVSAIKEELRQIQPGRYAEKPNSIAIPLLKRPPALDGSHAGDFGFDPLGFTEVFDLYTMQESEIRHARLAMLAVVGWPLSELVAPDFMLQENGCAPSVLNGFNLITFPAALAVFAALGFFEYQTALRNTVDTKMGKMHHEDYDKVWKWGVAGDYNWDPANLYNSVGNDAYSRKGLREVEISHGRSAMLGITAFAVWEAWTGHPIVENSMFFHPNLLLPALAAGWVAFNQVFELEESETFIRYKVSSEGQARLENFKMSLPKAVRDGPDAEKTEELFSKVSAFAEKVIGGGSDAEKTEGKTEDFGSKVAGLAEKAGDYLKKAFPSE